jgi:hypothetical protein
MPSPRSAQTNNSHPQRADSFSSTNDEVERDERISAEQVQWQAWFAAARDSPDVAVRLQALETWAQHPGEALDPVTYGLVDEDEQVRSRAQDFYQQQLAREATALVPVQEEPQEHQAER